MCLFKGSLILGKHALDTKRILFASYLTRAAKLPSHCGLISHVNRCHSPPWVTFEPANIRLNELWKVGAGSHRCVPIKQGLQPSHAGARRGSRQADKALAKPTMKRGFPPTHTHTPRQPLQAQPDADATESAQGQRFMNTLQC